MVSVCFVSDALFFGGAERYITYLAGGLDRAAFRPSLVMRTDGDERLDEWRRELESSDVPVTRVPMRAPFRPGDLSGIRSAIAANQPDIVHVNMPGPYDGQMGLAAPVARLAGARAVVTTEHLPMVEYLWKRALVKRFAYAFVDRVLTVCRANIAWLTARQAVPARRIRVVPNALERGYGEGAGQRDAVRREHGVPVEATVVTFVGNLLEHKGLVVAADALLSMPERPWHLLVVGSGPEEAKCRKLLARAGMESRCTFAGSVAPSVVADLLACSDLLTLPSRIEGMPYVILEAMASGLAVVATNVFGIPEMVVDGQTGLLVASGDVHALRDALARLVDDAELRGSFGTRARSRFLEYFTLETQIAAVEAVYGEVLSR